MTVHKALLKFYGLTSHQESQLESRLKARAKEYRETQMAVVQRQLSRYIS